MKTREELIAECTVHNNYEIAGFFGEARWLSNFHPAEIYITTAPAGSGRFFPTNEHVFMYSKLAANDSDGEIYRDVQKMTAAQVKAWGRTIQLRSDWERVKKKIMFDINFAKYSQHPDLKEKLLATGTKKLEERNYWGDIVWGFDINKGGRNWLGKILMMVRDLV